jgi:glycosyltransferase involved in cell wall biosynthesis
MPNPVFAFLAFTGGGFEGAIIRDMRLANALHRRGFKVFVYWLMQTNPDLVDPAIRQRVLVRGPRYMWSKPSAFFEKFSNLINLIGPSGRRRFIQQHPQLVSSPLRNFLGCMCDGWTDLTVVRRLESMLASDRVTHVLPTFAMVCPLALAAKQRGNHPFEYLPTFQGDEVAAHYAKELGRLDDYYAQLRRSAAASPWRAIAVSNDYADRLHDETGIDRDRFVTIYPGIDPPAAGSKPPFSDLTEKMPTLDPAVPIVSFFGRQDTEKGIDLLLYAARLLKDRGVKMQLVICGGSLFGLDYHQNCRQIAQHLGLSVFWRRRTTDKLRNALYAHSRCVVYPSIHREPFGMVAVEAMSHGTPVVVPDYGGVTEAIRSNGTFGGLTFKNLDTHDLADQLQRILTDESLYASLAANTRKVADNFTVDAMADRVLTHMGLPTKPQ